MGFLTPTQWVKLIGILLMLPLVQQGFRATGQDPRRAWTALILDIVGTCAAFFALMAAVLGIAFVLYRYGGFHKGAAMQVGFGAACLFVAVFQPRVIMYMDGPPPRDSWWQPERVALVVGVIGTILTVTGLLNLALIRI